ncbi:MAG: ATP-binding protein [Desulfobacteraceae bacterium]|nr:ATP-binding protein [Desulfobacteraceae bacterium]
MEHTNAKKIKTFTCPIHGKYKGNVVVYAGRERIPPCPKCFEDKEQVQRRFENKDNIERLQKLVGNSDIPIDLMGLKIESFKPPCPSAEKVLIRAKEYAIHFAYEQTDIDDRWFPTKQGPKSVLFLGNNGTGKTHLACAIAQDLLFYGKISTLKYLSAYDLSLAIKNSWFRESAQSEMQIVRGFVNLDFLIIDEIGAQFGSDTDELLFYQVFNKRLSNEKPTILISNRNADELKDLVGPRVTDRIREGLVFSFDWESHRGKDRETE